VKRTLVRAVAGLAPRSRAPGVRVLLYHAVDRRDRADRLSLRVPPALFREQMRFLVSTGYRVVPLNALSREAPSTGDHVVAITFDDGYRSQLEAAAILRGVGLPATFFLVAGWLDEDGASPPAAASEYWRRWERMGWTDVRSLAAGGFQIGAHSLTHRRLRGCPASVLHTEVAGARSRLERGLGGAAVTAFSYPHGAHDRASRAAVARAGYQLACTSQYGENRRPWRWFQLRRTEITGADTLDDFRRKLEGRYDWLAPWQRWRRGRA
jgi:peptidoglycan/xylan/chitin deacetylase (PgdA/CDA1 family)